MGPAVLAAFRRNRGAMIVLGFMPLEELLFAVRFGGYWAGVYEHYNWRRTE